MSPSGMPQVRGRDDGPVRGACEVLAAGRVGSYHTLTFVAPQIAERTRPGQFVTAGVSAPEAILRRPFSVYRTSRRGPWAGTLEIAFEVTGPGTAWLADRSKHDLVDLVGPLGRPFPMPRRPVGCLLVGGGYGAAPLYFLASRLREAGLRVDLLVGAATGERLLDVVEAKRSGSRTIITTDDGSMGRQGRVTDHLAATLDESGAQAVYACGPMPMLREVARRCADRGVACQVAVEEAMACGVGVCWTCVVPYRRRDGLRNVRACLEGPVLDGARVAWDRLGRPIDHEPPEEHPR